MLRKVTNTYISTRMNKFSTTKISFQAFTETPGTERYQVCPDNLPAPGDRIAANELFSLFTADIIKEQRIFTR